MNGLRLRTRRQSWTRILKKYWALYLMAIPGLVCFALFSYAPMYGVLLAFKDFSMRKGIMGSPWADPWYKYFKQFFDSPYFVQILRNTLVISIGKLVTVTFSAIFLAIALCEVRSTKFRRVAQTISYLPHFLSWVIVYGILYSMLSETYGVVNNILKSTTGTTVNFLSNSKYFRMLLILTNVWKEAGWSAIIYMAGIMGIDLSLYEAARVDGASRGQLVWHVTLPGIRSVIIMQLLLSIGSILSAGFDQVYVMYNVRVYEVADIIDTWVFRTGLIQWNYSLATAAGLFKSVIGTIMIVGANTLARRWGESMW